MINKKWISVSVLVIAFIFLSTAVYAKSSDSYSKKYTTSWWYKPYYHIKKTVKEVNNLQRQISKLQRKANRLERKKNMLEEQLSVLETDISALQERKNAFTNEDSTIEDENSEKDLSIAFCPKCNFIGVDDLTNYDLSWAYLRGSSFQSASLVNTDFSNANLKKCIFQSAKLNGVIFSGADLSGAIFDYPGSFKDVIWSDAISGDAICPDGFYSGEHEDGSCIEPLSSEN